MSTEIPSPEEMVKRVDAALQEIGIQVQLEITGDFTPDGWPVITWVYYEGPEEDFAAAWMAYRLAGAPISCWACWREGNPEKGRACYFGDCQSPQGPHTPPRELLKTRRA